MPGGSYKNLNEGDTLVHEMGHYLGLLHTFSSKSGTCSDETDDKVDDTPLEASPNYGCSARDSCSNHAGSDPIWSFMDYTRDACMTRFSPGQVCDLPVYMLNASWYCIGCTYTTDSTRHRARWVYFDRCLTNQV